MHFSEILYCRPILINRKRFFLPNTVGRQGLIFYVPTDPIRPHHTQKNDEISYALVKGKSENGPSTLLGPLFREIFWAK